jgi:pyruvate formate lyase activating enzyme
MYIGGFQKNSLIDFPETIACIVFTQGCNLICPYCHNPDLVASPLNRSKQAGDFYDANKIFGFLKARKGFLEGVVITGGEPTLQKDLISFCEKVKEIGYKIKLDSNGTRPKVLASLFDKNLIDYISMDIKTSLEKYNFVSPGKFDTKILTDSIQLLMEKAPLYEFRTTCSKPFINKAIMTDIGKMIQGAPKYILQKCSRNIKVLAPDFLKSDDDFFSDEQMLELQNVIDEYVLSSIVR